MSLKVTEIIEELPEVIRVDRDLPITPDELWDWVTRPELTIKWFGPWQRVNPDEDEIEIVMNREAGSPTQTAVILETNPKRGYTLAMGTSDPAPAWQILIHLSEAEQGGSHFTLIQPWDDETLRGEIQAGWEYYADCLRAAITETAFPEFSTYLDQNQTHGI